VNGCAKGRRVGKKLQLWALKLLVESFECHNEADMVCINALGGSRCAFDCSPFDLKLKTNSLYMNQGSSYYELGLAW